MNLTRCTSSALHEPTGEYYQCLGPANHRPSVNHWALMGALRLVWHSTGRPAVCDMNPKFPRPHYDGSSHPPRQAQCASNAVYKPTGKSYQCLGPVGHEHHIPAMHWALAGVVRVVWHSGQLAHAQLDRSPETGRPHYDGHTDQLREDTPVPDQPETKKSDTTPPDLADAETVAALRKLLNLSSSTTNPMVVAEVALRMQTPQTRVHVAVDPAVPGKSWSQVVREWADGPRVTAGEWTDDVAADAALSARLRGELRDANAKLDERRIDVSVALGGRSSDTWAALMTRLRPLHKNVTQLREQLAARKTELGDALSTNARLDRKLDERFNALVRAVGMQVGDGLLYGQLLDKVRELRTSDGHGADDEATQIRQLADALGEPVTKQWVWLIEMVKTLREQSGETVMRSQRQTAELADALGESPAREWAGMVEDVRLHREDRNRLANELIRQRRDTANALGLGGGTQWGAIREQIGKLMRERPSLSLSADHWRESYDEIRVAAGVPADSGHAALLQVIQRVTNRPSQFYARAVNGFADGLCEALGIDSIHDPGDNRLPALYSEVRRMRQFRADVAAEVNLHGVDARSHPLILREVRARRPVGSTQQRYPF